MVIAPAFDRVPKVSVECLLWRVISDQPCDLKFALRSFAMCWKDAQARPRRLQEKAVQCFCIVLRIRLSIFTHVKPGKVDQCSGVFCRKVRQAFTSDEIKRDCTLRVRVHDADAHPKVQTQILSKMGSRQRLGSATFLARRMDHARFIRFRMVRSLLTETIVFSRPRERSFKNCSSVPLMILTTASDSLVESVLHCW
jgi:hypothetical protein